MIFVKKRGILCLVLCICLFLCSCDRAHEDTPSGDNTAMVGAQKTLHILYNETDSFNPYATTTKENKELGLLLFDPLITLGTDFEPIYKIAEDIALDGKTCTVKIKPVLHSDGSRLSADDVVYSANLARESKTVYASQLAGVSSITAVNGTTVVFTLKKSDPFFVNLLDFPIIKAGSESIKSEDNIILPPIGAGRYVLDTESASLSPNPTYYGGSQAIGSIKLINAPGRESIDHYVSSGVVSVCYNDFGDNTVPQMSGLKASVPLNNMVFIGINMSQWRLKNQYLRYAISSAVNRNEIVSEAYYGNGTVAEGPFNPLWEHGKGFQTLESESNTQISVVNLEKIGYNGIDNEGFRLDSSGRRITLRLLVNSDNSARLVAGRLIAARLEKVGIEVTLDAVDYNTYLAKLARRDFDLYLGEIRLLNNMDLTELVTPGGSAAFGIAPTVTPEQSEEEPAAPSSGITLTSARAVAGFYSGEYTIGDVASAFLSEMPVIPLLYRSGIAMFTPDMTEVPEVSVSDIFIDINNYSFK